MTIKDGVRPIAPPWLADGVGGKILDSVCDELDEIHSRVRQGIKARFPGVGTPTALPYIGRDRKIERGLVEDDDTYAARLPGAFDEHATRGNPHTLLRQLRAFLAGTAVPKIRVVNDRAVWHEIDCTTGVVTRTIAVTSNWKWDAYAKGVAPAGTQRWWRAWVIIDMSSGPWAGPPAYGDPITYGDGTLFGLSGATATRENLERLKRLCKTWKPQGAHLVHIITTFDGSLFRPSNAPGGSMPAGTFDEPTNRPTAAAYLGGVI